MLEPLVRDLVLAYALALVFVVGLARLRVPALVALILAGAVAGPAALGIVRTEAQVETLAEIGVVFLLFTVGLDFSMGHIQRIWRTVIIGGALQIAATVVCVILVLMTVMPTRVAVFIGLFVALSSTAVVLRELGQRNELDTLRGRLAVGILLFQDLAVVVLLLLVPFLSGEMELVEVPAALGRAVLAIAAVAFVSRRVLPPVLRAVTAAGRREVFVLAVALAGIGTAWMSSLLGVSTAVGAFLAGLALAESEFSHQAYAEIRPLRDILASLFFISLGMLLDPVSVWSNMWVILSIAAGIMVIKALVATGALVIVATPLRIAVAAGMSLAQVGEFSFILGRAGLESQLISEAVWQTLLAASVMTMACTPILLAVGSSVAATLLRRGTPGSGEEPLTVHTLADHIVILGFGVGGRLLAKALREVKVPYVILELNGTVVRRLALEGESILYGDATNLDALQKAGVERARGVVAVLSDVDASRRAVIFTRTLSATVPILVRTRYRVEAEAMQRAGATISVAEELEASLEVIAQLFGRLEMPGNVTETLLEGFRQDSASVRPLHAPRSPLEQLPTLIRQTPIATHQLHSTDWAVGRTIAELNLRVLAGISVLAIQRDREYFTSPSSDMALTEADVLYLVGGDRAIKAARVILTSGSAPTSAT